MGLFSSVGEALSSANNDFTENNTQREINNNINNENSMRILKFETLIEDISKSIYGNSELTKCAKSLGVSSALSSFLDSIESNNYIEKNNTKILLIYNYNDLNDYGKIIVKKSNFYLNFGESNWDSKYRGTFFSNDKVKLEAAKEFIEIARKDKRYSYNFIFWAMMVLAVDKSNQEKHLSLICDFARMLKVSDDEMLDILHVIKVIFRKEDKNYNFKNKYAYEHFKNVLNLY